MTSRPAALEAAQEIWSRLPRDFSEHLPVEQIASLIEQALSATSEPVKDARTMQERLESVGYTFTPLASPSAGGEAASDWKCANCEHPIPKGQELAPDANPDSLPWCGYCLITQQRHLGRGNEIQNRLADAERVILDADHLNMSSACDYLLKYPDRAKRSTP